MTNADLPERAIARWLAQGATSLTHPILRHVLETFFLPLGIDAEWLEAEPFSALESGSIGWWLRRPRWAPELFDSRSPAAADFRILLEQPRDFAVAVGTNAILSFTPGGADPATASTCLGANDGGWPAIRHSLRASHGAESFIIASAGVLLAGDPSAALYAAGNDEGFCKAIHERLALPESKANDSTVSANNVGTGRERQEAETATNLPEAQ